MVSPGPFQDSTYEVISYDVTPVSLFTAAKAKEENRTKSVTDSAAEEYVLTGV